jgi:hypothetical protein
MARQSVNGEADMTDKEHVETLRKAREQMVKTRREWVRTLAQSFDRHKTPDAIAGLIEAQQAIEAIDKAIKDETSPSAHIV